MTKNKEEEKIAEQVELEEGDQNKKLAVIDHKKYTTYPDITSEFIEILRKTVCKDFTLAETYYYLNVCDALGMNPHLRLVWAFKDKENKTYIFAGRDGFLYNARKSPNFKGITSAEVRDGDDFEVDFPTGNVIHKTKPTGTKAGEVYCAWAKVERAGETPRIAVCYLPDYQKSSWKNIPAMIKKCAEAEALKKCFPLYGVDNENDFDFENGKVKPRKIQSEETQEDLAADEQLQRSTEELLSSIDDYRGENKMQIVEEIRNHIKNKTLTMEVIEEYMSMMPSEI